MYHMMFYLILLKSKPEKILNSYDLYVLEYMKKNGTNFFPFRKSLSICENQEEADEWIIIKIVNLINY